MQDIQLAMKWMDEGQTDKAVQHLENVYHEKSPDEKFTIAQIFEDWGYFEKAIDKYADLLKSFPSETELKIKLAELYIELKNDDHALQMLENISEHDDYYPHALMLQADLYERIGIPEVAEQKLLEAKQYVAKEEQYIVDFAIAELLFAIGEMKRAITFYEKVLSTYDEVNYISVNERLAESYAYLGEYEQALQYYRKLDDQTPDLLFKHGFVANQAKERKEAIALWEELIAIEPDYTSVYSELAEAYEAEGLLKEAYEVAQKGITYDEFNKKLYFIAGKLAIKLEKHDEAKKLLYEAIALDEDYKDAVMLLVTLLKKLESFEEIIILIERMKSNQVTDPNYEWELARAYEQVEDYNNAKAAYEEASFFLKNDSEFLKEYGYFLVEEGETEKAKAIFEHYINIVPNDEEVLAFMERFFF